MDIPQARTLLQKISQLLDNVEHSHAKGSRLERDLLLEYTRRLYDSLSAEAFSSDRTPGKGASITSSSANPAQVTPEVPNLLAGSISDSETTESGATGSVAPVSEADSSSSDRDPFTGSAPAILPSESVATAAVIEEVPDPIPASPPSGPDSASVTAESGLDVSPLFVFHEARDLGDKLRLSRIEDLSKAMGINERFLTINELFGGNHETFDRVLRHLNGLPTFDDARLYLEQEVIPAFGWLDDKKQKKATIFIQLVQRRYL